MKFVFSTLFNDCNLILNSMENSKLLVVLVIIQIIIIISIPFLLLSVLGLFVSIFVNIGYLLTTKCFSCEHPLVGWLILETIFLSVIFLGGKSFSQKICFLLWQIGWIIGWAYIGNNDCDHTKIYKVVLANQIIGCVFVVSFMIIVISALIISCLPVVNSLSQILVVERNSFTKHIPLVTEFMKNNKKPKDPEAEQLLPQENW